MEKEETQETKEEKTEIKENEPKEETKEENDPKKEEDLEKILYEDKEDNKDDAEDDKLKAVGGDNIKKISEIYEEKKKESKDEDSKQVDVLKSRDIIERARLFGDDKDKKKLKTRGSAYFSSSLLNKLHSFKAGVTDPSEKDNEELNVEKSSKIINRARMFSGEDKEISPFIPNKKFKPRASAILPQSFSTRMKLLSIFEKGNGDENDEDKEIKPLDSSKEIKRKASEIEEKKDKEGEVKLEKVEVTESVEVKRKASIIEENSDKKEPEKEQKPLVVSKDIKRRASFFEGIKVEDEIKEAKEEEEEGKIK